VARPKSWEAEIRKVVPLLAYQADPIRESVKRLGKKWALLILRDMAFLKLDRFGQILRNNPGLTPRVLSRRLDQMEAEGLVHRVQEQVAVRYELTERGEDAVFILLAFLRYGIKHHMGSNVGVRSRAPAVPSK
jgi:DNA-binding HxlR family transcriptional regulator